MVRSIIMLAACAALFSACSGPAGGAGPRGWNHPMDNVWTKPASKHDVFIAETRSYSGTLADLASLTTTNMVLHGKAKLLSAAPFQPCPALAGLQTYQAAGKRLVKVAFAVQNGRMVQAKYLRDDAERDDPAAIDAMAANVCALP